ncbi:MULTISPECIES: TetR/AcrR family transcriptional regulator [unclassified Pseudonocardia]|uniref:TetR/AcrR family transcriptional regulator n=1 Tax=unclassified Pseudonocardia TaxID=2619320 RepID=UPI0007613D68|nr:MULTISPECIES: TetR/AcrR family transcriptional regulator [unclassified Pseudonocardia]
MSKSSGGGRPRAARTRVSDPATAILLAAEACYLRLGITKTTMDDIAREAGVSRPTVYRHYSNRDDLVLGVLLSRARDLLERARRFIDTRARIDDKLVDGMIFLVDAGSRDPMLQQLVSLEFMEGMQGHPEASRLPVTLSAELWGPIVQDAKDAGEVRADLDVTAFCTWLTYIELVVLSRTNRPGSTDEAQRSLMQTFVAPALHRAGTYGTVPVPAAG